VAGIKVSVGIPSPLGKRKFRTERRTSEKREYKRDIKGRYRKNGRSVKNEEEIEVKNPRPFGSKSL